MLWFLCFFDWLDVNKSSLDIVFAQFLVAQALNSISFKRWIQSASSIDLNRLQTMDSIGFKPWAQPPSSLELNHWALSSNLNQNPSNFLSFTRTISLKLRKMFFKTWRKPLFSLFSQFPPFIQSFVPQLFCCQEQLFPEMGAIFWIWKEKRKVFVS